MKVCALVGLAVGLQGYAQCPVSGVVMDAQTGEPLPYANIFYDQTTIGTSSDLEGKFYMEHCPPAAESTIVVSYVGYQAWMKAGGVQGGVLIVRLMPESSQLSAVEIRDKRDSRWENDFRNFRREFLGSTANGQNSRIVNPEFIDLKRSRDLFTATSSKPIEIVNESLGYRVTFYLRRFEVSAVHLAIVGQTHFVELNPSGDKEGRKWLENRRKAYLGSDRHFFRAVLEGTAVKEGFQLYSEVKFQKRIVRSETFSQDRGSRVIPQTIVIQAYPGQEIYSIPLPRRLEVHYTLAESTPYYRDISCPVSWIQPVRNAVRVNRAGAMIDPAEAVVFGYWRDLRVADMLPLDYDPLETSIRHRE